MPPAARVSPNMEAPWPSWGVTTINHHCWPPLTIMDWPKWCHRYPHSLTIWDPFRSLGDHPENLRISWFSCGFFGCNICRLSPGSTFSLQNISGGVWIWISMTGSWLFHAISTITVSHSLWKVTSHCRHVLWSRILGWDTYCGSDYSSCSQVHDSAWHCQHQDEEPWLPLVASSNA